MTGAEAGVPFPVDLTGTAVVPFVARDGPWAPLDAAWSEVCRGGRRTVLLAGEAGTGKSRLASEFARRAHEDGSVVLHGACPEDGRTAYAPFRDVVDWVVRSAPPEAVDLPAELVDRLRPLTDLRGSAPSARPAAEDERFRVTDAVTELLDVLASSTPVLVVLDDLHWADPATLALLDDLTRGARPGRCGLVVTHRTEPAALTPEVRATLADLRRRPGVVGVPVSPFDEPGIRAFVEAAAGHPVHVGLEGVIGFLAEETGGNAFFLGELWRHLVELGVLVRPGHKWRLEGRLDLGPSPPGVRDVVASRLARLPPATRRVVEVAAVIGATFDHAVLAGATDASPSSVLADLQPACAGGMIHELRPGWGRFDHALVRRAAYDEQPVEVRHERHLAVARALQRLGHPGGEVDVASHLLAAVPLVERAEAVAAARDAARVAFAGGRHSDAASALGAALDVVDPSPARGRMLLELAEARMRAGDVEGAEAVALEAHGLGVRHRDGGLVVDAALVHAEAVWRAALPGERSREVVETALTHAAEPLAALRLRAAGARALALSGKDDAARTEAEEVLAEAQRTGDVDTVRAAYHALLFTAWTPDSVDRLLAIGRAFVDLAVSVGNEEWEVAALDKVLLGLIIRGELDEARRIAARHHLLAEAVGQPLFRVLDHQCRTLLAVGEGRFDDAEREADDARDVGRFLSGRDASGGYGVQMFSLRREQGRLDEARPMVEAVARLGHEAETWRPALAVLYAELGMETEASAVLDDLVATDLRSVPRDSLWPATLVYLAESAVAVGHQPAVERLRAELVPYRGRIVVAGTFLAAYGAADRYLGSLAAAAGDQAAAVAHLEEALRLETSCRMPVWVARTQLALGRALLRAGEPDAAERGSTLVRFAADTAARLGMRSVEAAARATLEHPVVSARPRGPAVSELTDRELAVLRLLAEGASNRQIGEVLHISHHTAANHVRAILLKSGSRNRTEAAAWALRLGLAAD